MTHRNNNEREFEAFLAGEESGLARLYRRLPQSEPDAKLDAAVLAMARAAVEPQRMNALRHAKDRHRRPLWLVGLSGAAGVVLAAGLAWQMRGAFNETLPSSTGSASPAARANREVIPISAIVPPPEPAPEDVAAAAPPPAQAVVPMAPPAPAAPAAPPTEAAKGAPRMAKTAPHKREADVATASADKKDQAQRFEAEPPRASAPPAAVQEALAAATDAEAGAAEARTGAEAARTGTVPGNDGPRAQPFPGTAAPDYNSVERKAAIASGTRRDDYGLGADAGSTDPLVKQEERARLARQSSKEKVPAGRGLAGTSAAPAVAAETAAAPKAVLQDAAPAAAAPKPAAAPPTTTAATAPANADTRAETELQRNARLAPDEWVKAIRELLRAERKADAIENLELLRRRHPDYVVPEDLRTLHR
jgi:hypothetical protein